MNSYCHPAKRTDEALIVCETSDKGKNSPNNCHNNKSLCAYVNRGITVSGDNRASINICVDKLLPCSGNDGTNVAPCDCWTNAYGLKSPSLGDDGNTAGAMVHEMTHGCGFVATKKPANAKAALPFEYLTQAIASCLMSQLVKNGLTSE